jgi:hypothetical protein
VCACVARATATALCELKLAPMADASEEAAAARLVPAVKRQTSHGRGVIGNKHSDSIESTNRFRTPA